MSQRKGDWICTYTGRQFWPLDPRPEEVCAEDIAHALSMQCRFTGHTREFYSVAEHSLRVGKAIHDRMKPGFDRIVSFLYGLLHDAAEAYLVDVARPVKKSPEMAAYCEAEKRIEKAIYRHFKLPVHRESGGIGPGPIVKECDNVLLVTEARDLMNGFDDRWRHWTMLADALPEQIKPYSPRNAKTLWLNNLENALDAMAEWRSRHNSPTTSPGATTPSETSSTAGRAECSPGER